VIPNDVQCSNAVVPTGLTTPTATSSGGSLAFTGANVLRALLVAAVLILVGLVLLAVTRERRRMRR
jgi:hypothetical protein